MSWKETKLNVKGRERNRLPGLTHSVRSRGREKVVKTQREAGVPLSGKNWGKKGARNEDTHPCRWLPSTGWWECSSQRVFVQGGQERKQRKIRKPPGIHWERRSKDGKKPNKKLKERLRWYIIKNENERKRERFNGDEGNKQTKNYHTHI
jgi:hypothetical protein